MGKCLSTPKEAKEDIPSPPPPKTDKGPAAPAANGAAEPTKAANPNQKTVNVLLLGPGESGKSTFFKQLKIIQEDGISEAERLRWVGAIHMNVLSQMRILVDTAFKEELEFESAEAKTAAQHFTSMEQPEWNPTYGPLVKTLWNDPSIRRIYSERDRLFALNDGAKHFFDNIDRIQATDYVPSETDILSVRIRSATFEQASYVYKETKFRVWDIGGQIPERKKWRKHIIASTAIFFFSSLTEYDQKLREDASTCRLADTLELFGEICLLDSMKSKTVVLMLNKVDLFKNKIGTKSIRVFFPDYKGPDTWEASAEHIRKEFLSRSNHLDVLTHFVCALDTNMAKVIWTSCRDILLKKTLENAMTMLS